MESNLCCPKIAGKPLPAYPKAALLDYFSALSTISTNHLEDVDVGIEIPPYKHKTQFEDVLSSLLESSRGRRCPISFITAIDTLGNHLLVDDTSIMGPTIDSPNGAGVGGLGDPALHPLALGNVAILRRLLSKHEDLKAIDLVGVGGVSDTDGYNRMRNVGASAVGVGTALGVDGVKIFSEIFKGITTGEDREDLISMEKLQV